MRIINATDGMTSILLGRMGENERTQVVFDVADWIEEYPNASFVLMNQLPHSEEEYPVVISQPVDGKIRWTVSGTELQVDGYGNCALEAVEGTVVSKKHVWRTKILKAMGQSGDPPEPWENWMTEFARMVDDAQDAADDALEAADDAEAWAVGQRGGEDVPDTDETYHNNSKYYAEQTEELLEDLSGQIREDVENWLDEHPEATTTVDFAIATKVFPTVAAMVADMTLKNGDNVATRGYYASEDNGGANYVVSASHAGLFYVTLSNGLYANMLSEKGVLRAESIGIKAYASETANPDTEDMDRNVSLFNTAHYNGVLLQFGRGHFYFSSPLLLAHKGQMVIQGIGRDWSWLHFPNSNGLYFCDPIYYGYYVVKALQIVSYGHCIVCDESCLTVLDSHFEWLYLTSETGDCFHGPSYNVAHYITPGGTEIYDTCVQNCVFDFINASAPNGAAFCNIMGMYTYYQHLNFVSCKWAFRNCDGILKQANTLGTAEEYFIYYDKTLSHSLKWRFEDVNAEGIEKAFIYTEPEVLTPEGEDPKKPETANQMTLNITAINSGWSLSVDVEECDEYPITVHTMSSITLVRAHSIVAPTRYPSYYDTSVVQAHIKCTRSFGMTQYNGGPDIVVYNSNANQFLTYYGDNTRKRITQGNSGGYSSLEGVDVRSYGEIYADLIYGGKGLNVWEVNASEIGTQPTPPREKTFFDVFVVNNDTNSQKGLASIQSTNFGTYPGRIITVVNSTASLKNINLNSVNDNRNHSNFCLSKDSFRITLTPGQYVNLISAFEESPSNGNVLRVWRPLDPKYLYNDPKYEEMYHAIKETSSKQIYAVTEGYYIKNHTSTVDVTSVLEGTAGNGHYGIKYALIPCSQGDEFRILNGLGSMDSSNLWSFVSGTGQKLEGSGYAKSGNFTVTAPANAAYLIVDSFTYPIVFKTN